MAMTFFNSYIYIYMQRFRSDISGKGFAVLCVVRASLPCQLSGQPHLLNEQDLKT